MSVSKLRLFIHNSCQAKVTYLHIAISIKKDVAWLQVSVQNALRISAGLAVEAVVRRSTTLSVVDLCVFLSAVALIKSESDLHEDLPDDILSHMVLLFPGSPDNHGQVTSLAVLHDDVNALVGFVYDPVVVLHDVWVC